MSPFPLLQHIQRKQTPPRAARSYGPWGFGFAVEEYRGRSRAKPDPADPMLAVSAFELDHHVYHLTREVQDIFAGGPSSRLTSIH